MSSSKNILLCADDFGAHSGISAGILELSRLGRLSAVSCMVNGERFNLDAQNLLDIKHPIRMGLHFNLTEGCLLSQNGQACFGLNELLIKAHCHRIKKNLITEELHAQLDYYIKVIGSLPSFIDGHQHVHQFPQIRQIVLDVYEQRLKAHGTFIRATYPIIGPPRYRFKKLILAMTGGKALHRRLNELDIPHNPYFSGIYDFAHDADYRSLFQQWLSLASDNTLIMCHPGIDAMAADPIGLARQKEYDYFLSDLFLEDCDKYDVHIA